MFRTRPRSLSPSLSLSRGKCTPRHLARARLSSAGVAHVKHMKWRVRPAATTTPLHFELSPRNAPQPHAPLSGIVIVVVVGFATTTTTTPIPGPILAALCGRVSAAAHVLSITLTRLSVDTMRMRRSTLVHRRATSAQTTTHVRLVIASCLPSGHATLPRM